MSRLSRFFENARQRREARRVRFDIEGLATPIVLRLHGSDEHVSDTMRRLSEWEPTETRCVSGMLAQGGLAIDVGANIGYYAILFSRLVGRTGQVVALEPDPKNYSLLRRNLRSASARNVRCYRAAAAEQDGSTTMFRSSENFGDHRVYRGPEHTIGGRVRTRSLAGIIGRLGRAPDLIKIDCQGSEVRVLKGLSGVMDTPGLAPAAIIVEFWPSGLADAGSDLSDLTGFLSDDSYALWDIGPWGSRPCVTDVETLSRRAADDLNPDGGLFTNVLMIRKDRADLHAHLASVAARNDA